MFQSVDRSINGAMYDGVFPGAVIAVRHEGSLVHHKAYGFTASTRRQRTTTDVLYDIASLTKPIFAMALLSFLEEEAIPLDTRVGELIDELSTSHHGPLTLRHLLEHTSGQPRRFTRLTEAAAALELHRENGAAVTDEERLRRTITLLEDLRDVELLFEPGSRVAYSSLGYFVLGVVAERMSGKSIDSLLFSTVLDEARVPSLKYLPLRSQSPAQIAPTEVCPWRGVMSHGVVHDEVTGFLCGVAGHAGLFGTASDVATFGGDVLRSNGLGKITDNTLRDSTRNHTASVPGDNRGWGWQIWSRGCFMGERVSPSSFGHTGFTGTSLLIDPDNQLVVALLTNRVNPTRKNNRIAPVQRDVHEAIGKEILGAEAG